MATTQERIARVLLSVGVDKRELTNTTKQLDTFNKTLKDLERQRGLSKLAQDSAKAVAEGRNLRTEIIKLKSELVKIGASDKDIERVVREFDKLIARQNAAAESAKRLRKAQEDAAAAGIDAALSAAEEAQAAQSGRGRLARFGAQARLSLPAVPIGGGVSSEVIFRGIQGLGLAQDAIGALGIQGKVTALGIGVLTVAIVALLVETTRRNKEAEIAAQGALKGASRYFELIATGTQESLNGLLNQAKLEQQIAKNRLDFNQSLLTGLETAVDAGGAFSRVTAEAGVIVNGLLKTQPELVQTRTAVDEAKAAFAAANAEVAAIESALNSTEVAANTAAAALEEMNKRLAEINDRGLQTIIQTQIQVAKLSAENIRDRLRGIEIERKAILDAQQSGLASVELFQELNDRLQDLGTQAIVLEGALPKAEQIETAKRVFETIKEGLKEAAERAGEIKKIGQAVTELRGKLTDSLREIAIKQREAEAEAERDRDIAISEARRDSGIAEAEAVRKAGIDRAEIEQKSQDRIKQILRRSKFDEENAIQDRDAVALDAARRRRDEEVTTEQDNRREQLGQLDGNLKEQLRTIRLRLGEQLRTIDNRYKEQVRRAQIAAERSIRIETEKFQRELALKQQALSALLNIEQTGASRTLAIHSSFWQQAVTIGAQAVNALRGSGTPQAAQVAKLPPRNLAPNTSQRVPTLATGGRLLTDGLFFGHAGEMVINPNRGQAAGVNPVFNITGQTRQQVRRQMDRATDDLIDIMFPGA